MHNVFLHFYIDTISTVVFFMYMLVTLIAPETERETESESSKFYEVPFDTKNFEREGRGIDAVCRVCTVFLFMYMPVTLIASETERETESESREFHEVPLDPKILERGV
jgi:hypothetical protein